MKRYFVYYIDKNSGRISSGIAPAASKEEAYRKFDQYGRVLAVLGFEDGRFIKTYRLSGTLHDAGYTGEEIEFICAAVSEFEARLGR